jgi:hypothetical protein
VDNLARKAHMKTQASQATRPDPKNAGLGMVVSRAVSGRSVLPSWWELTRSRR